MSATPDSTLANPEQRIADLERQLAECRAERDEALAKRDECKAERDEALDQQTATSEVLQVINSSPGDLASVFDAILERAMRLCGAAFGHLARYDGERFHLLAAAVGESAIANRLRGWGPTRPSRTITYERILRGAPFIHLANIAEDDKYRAGHPTARAYVDEDGVRTLLTVALRTEDKLLGCITVYRQEEMPYRDEVRPFTDKQIALLQNFAAQAVIAMENARLITETKEALEQQTATAEVLQVINTSPGDLAPVFEAMLAKATRLCEAPFGHLRTWDGECFHLDAAHGEPRFRDWFRQRGPIRPDRDASPLGRILAGERVVSFVDVPGDEGYRTSDPGFREMVEASGIRSAIWVALHKDDALLGTITVYRQEVRPFTDKQIALLQNFAAQAVIAMENARLLTETREALEQQTATAEVLQVINSSPGDLTPVFDAMVERAARLCEADEAALRIFDGELLHLAAVHGSDPEVVSRLRQLGPTRAFGLYEPFARGDRMAHYPDVRETDIFHEDAVVRARLELRGIRTWLAVALQKDGVLLGVINVHRHTVRPFSDKQVALLQNFAAQAVIAMENARLLTETHEALEQQTATAEVLGVINSSPGNLAPVFDTILEKAHSVCGASRGGLVLYDGELLRAAATRGYPEEYAALIRKGVLPEQVSAFQRLRQGERVVHVHDAATLPSLPPVTRAAVEIGGVRTSLSIPLRREGVLLGYISAQRGEVRAYSDQEIALLENFAAQAVIAMENARLITETREALEQQQAIAEILQVINRSPGELQPVFEILLEKAMQSCGAAFGILAAIDREQMHTVAARGLPQALAEWRRNHPVISTQNTLAARVLSGEPYVHTVDLKDDDLYRQGEPLRCANVDLGGARTSLYVPLLRGRDVLGTIHIYRQEVRPFTDKQIALLQNFAAQAVIAMENARLLTETREALEQQTATSEVLQVINSSPGDLKPVFDSLLEKALRLCEAAFGLLIIWDGEQFHRVAFRGVPDELIEAMRQPLKPVPGGFADRLVRGESVIAVTDLLEAVEQPIGPGAQLLVRFGARSYVAVALRRDDALLGGITIYRRDVRPFSEKEIALLQNFAQQAVIAMENARLLTETREALEQQTATAEVLQVINSSPGDLGPVFDAMLEKATRLCEATSGLMWTTIGERFQAVAVRGMSPEFVEFLRDPDNQPRMVGSNLPIGRVVRGEPLVHVLDLMANEFTHEPPALRKLVELGGFRTILALPLRNDSALLGAFVVGRREVRPFTDKQIALLESFAAQAVIAMENARLLTETREALEQQTATADVLGVINSSPGDLAPVFDAVLGRAVRLCEAEFGTLWTYDGERLHAAGLYRVPEQFAEFLRQPISAADSAVYATILSGKGFVQVPDLAGSDAYREGNSLRRATVDLGGARSGVAVALRKDTRLLGIFALYYRHEVRPFTDKQIALLQNFAAQAVIAMENARLITETREALEQQTATAEVLRVISSSPTDVQPTFEAIAARATNLCDAISGGVFRFDGSLIHLVAQYGWTPSELEVIRRVFPIPPSRGSVTARAILTRSVAHVADVTVDPEFAYPSIAQSGFRTVLVVPMLRDGIAVGAINVSRREVRPFSQPQIELLKTFADQAVIAIENVRLFNELRERTDDLTHSVEELQALSEVSQAVSSSLDLKEVLSKILTYSVALSGADAGVGFRYSRGARAYRLTEAQGWDPELVEQVRRLHIDEAETGMGEAAARGTPVQFADLEVRPSYPLRDVTLAAGFRSVLIMPLIGTDRVFGAIVLERRAVGEFPERAIRLMQTFANQSVLAIQNARLLGEIQAGKEAAEEANKRTEVAYRDLKAAQASLIQAEKMASLGQLTAGIAHEIKNPLNFVNNFAGLSVELLDELKETAAPGFAGLGEDKQAEIDETITMLTGNLERIAEHGRRADGIVKSMLEHSRGSSGERRSVDFNGLIEEALNLAYHGARAQDASFNITLERDFASTIAPIELVPQDITRVCLNLIGNGFYAVTKRQREGGDSKFKPTLKVSTRDLGDAVEVQVRDNGTGIAPEIKDKLFQPFFTTKPTGEGTGLGLSISYDIVTQQHGGTIAVDSRVGEYTEFTVRLPRSYRATMAEAAS